LGQAAARMRVLHEALVIFDMMWSQPEMVDLMVD
jgi:hypothetical protein